MQRAQAMLARWACQEAQDGHGPRPASTEIGRFLSLFVHRCLAFDLFAVLEDCRLDFRLKVEYPGIRQATRRVQAEALASRPRIEALPVQAALVELLIHMSLEQFTDLSVPQVYTEVAVMLARLVHALRTAQATVEDTAEATLRAYEIISHIRNEPYPADQWQPRDLEKLGDFRDAAYEALIAQLQMGQDTSGESGDAYEAPQPVDYRGAFKPAMVQLLTRLRMGQHQPDEGLPLTQGLLQELVQGGSEWVLDAEQGNRAMPISLFAQNLLQAAGVPLPSAKPPEGVGPVRHDDNQGEALVSRAPHTYAYDEWDCCAAAYKPKWCLVKEKTLEEGEPTFYHETLKRYASLLHHIKRQFERLVPERFRKVYRLIDGEDLELNAALEAWADLRLQVAPDDKIYWRRNKVQRDVALVFLLDMSASTAEPIDADDPLLGTRGAPGDPAAYLAWRRRQERLDRPAAKRIIDVAKASTVLLIQALESIGDTYGIYGFSGAGRENVEFYVIKDIAERFGERIKRRLDTITPLHATRMGAAIRHAITKLDQQPTATKILLLISDGRPQDRGYSRKGAEQEYAVHDTHMALLEAKQKGITPFCLTVDKAGHDYLKTMCGDMGYEVLDEIGSLPERLPMLYRALTI